MIMSFRTVVLSSVGVHHLYAASLANSGRSGGRDIVDRQSYGSLPIAILAAGMGAGRGPSQARDVFPKRSRSGLSRRSRASKYGRPARRAYRAAQRAAGCELRIELRVAHDQRPGARICGELSCRTLSGAVQAWRVGAAPERQGAWRASCPHHAWRTISLAGGRNKARARALPAFGYALRQCGAAEHEAQETLLVERPVGEVSPRNIGSPLSIRRCPSGAFVDLAKMRWRIERDYLKQEIGLGHYEGRGWPGFHHHGTLCIAAYGFSLISERENDSSEPRFAGSRKSCHSQWLSTTQCHSDPNAHVPQLDRDAASTLDRGNHKGASKMSMCACRFKKSTASCFLTQYN